MSFQLAALAGRAHDPIDIWNLIFQQGINKLVYDEGPFLLWFIIKTLPGAPLYGTVFLLRGCYSELRNQRFTAFYCKNERNKPFIYLDLSLWRGRWSRL